jgi:ABC-2 type transport system permease protein
MMMRLPMALFAVLFLDLRLPAEASVWLGFGVTMLLGHAIMFCFDWLLACIVFYTTDAWGLATARAGFALVFSGAFLPLAMMPDWWRSLALVLPFAQAVYWPISVLSGLTPLSQLPRLWALQAVYLVAMLLISRLAFSRAVRVITVHGG